MAFWFIFDYTGDLIYLIDLFVYKHCLMYMENGFWVKDKKRLTRQYVREGTFKLDLLALLPLGELNGFFLYIFFMKSISRNFSWNWFHEKKVHCTFLGF